MKSSIWILIMFSMCLIICTSNAQQTAITDDGKEVLLKNDGTWEYLKEDTARFGQYDFRKVNWGSEKDQVKSSESAKLEKEEDDALFYTTTVSNMNALIGYIFAEGQLVRASYVFLAEHSNKNDYITDYKEISKACIEKYGSPKSDETIWRDKLYLDDNSQWGFAISLGHLVYFATWESQVTEILLKLSGENFKVKLILQYTSKKLKNLEEKKIEKKRQAEF